MDEIRGGGKYVVIAQWWNSCLACSKSLIQFPVLLIQKKVQVVGDGRNLNESDTNEEEQGTPHNLSRYWLPQVVNKGTVNGRNVLKDKTLTCL